MHAIRAYIRSHLYGAHATPRATPVASRPDTPGVVSVSDRTPRRRRAQALTRALVRALRSFDPRRGGARSGWYAPVPT